jgi:hypothetical protein
MPAEMHSIKVHFCGYYLAKDSKPGKDGKMHIPKKWGLVERTIRDCYRDIQSGFPSQQLRKQDKDSFLNSWHWIIKNHLADMLYQDHCWPAYKKFTQWINAINWGLHSGVRLFEEDRWILEIMYKETQEKKSSIISIVAHQRISSRRDYPETFIGKKVEKLARCEQRILDEIFNNNEDKIETALKSNNKIGIELEVQNGPWRDWYHNDRFDLSQHWRMVEDGSLDSRGMEFVSPPLEPKEALDSFNKLVENIKNRSNARGDSGCGLHFHIGLDEKSIPKDPYNHPEFREVEDRIIAFIKRHEKTQKFDTLFTEDRYENDYCTLAPCIKQGRYYAVNFDSIEKHGTIEIRFCAVSPDFSARWRVQFRQFVTWVLEECFPPPVDKSLYLYNGSLKATLEELANKPELVLN